MRLRDDNLMFRRRDLQSPSVLCLFCLLAVSYPRVSFAESTSKLMSLSGFRNMVLTIAMLNRAMQDAAENPMDQWRRQNVQHAMGLMPGAVMGLAAEFKANKLGDSALPRVQSMLGGFVNVHAADAYQKFLRSPSKDLIPKVGKDFPVGMDNRGGGSPSAGAASMIGATVGSSAPSSNAPNPQLANLTQSSIGGGSDPGGGPDQGGLYFDDSAKKGDSSAGSSLSDGTKAEWDTKSSPSGSFLDDAVRDIASLEASESAQTEIGDKPESSIFKQPSATQADDGFFKKEGPRKNKKSSISKRSYSRKIEQKKGASLLPEAQNREWKPKFWMGTSSTLAPLWLVGLRESPAFAEGGDDGGGGGGSGARAAEFLYGIAAIMAAASPMVAVAVEADANKKIAQTNANAQIGMTEITADTSRYLATQQRDIALTQATIAAGIAGNNQQETTNRLGLQLAAMQQARQASNAQDDKRLALEQWLDQSRINLGQQQLNQSNELATKQFEAQETQAGLNQGFIASSNSGAGIAVQRTLTPVSSNGGVASNISNALQSRMGNNGVGGGPGSGLGGAPPPGPAGTAVGFVSSRREAAANRLLAGVSPESGGLAMRATSDPMMGMRILGGSAGQPVTAAVFRQGMQTATAGSSPIQISQTLRSVMNSQVLVRGSTPKTLVKASTLVASRNGTNRSRGDFSRLLQTTTSEGPDDRGDFSSYLERERTGANQSRPMETAASPSIQSGHAPRADAYNAPVLSEDGAQITPSYKRRGVVTYSGER